jgi:hypothetical protein
VTDNTTSFSTMKEQVGKKNVIHRPSQWVNPPSLKLEDGLFGRETNPDLSYSKIKKQVGKKGVSKKSKKDRLADKTVLLADRFRHHPYK